MAGRTIPEPSKSELAIAMGALMTQAEAFGLDVMDPDVHAFLEHESKVKAQMMAETRWLRNMTHDPSKLADFLAKIGVKK